MSIPLAGTFIKSRPYISQRSSKLPLPQPVQPQCAIGIPTGCCRHKGIGRIDPSGRANGTTEGTATAGWTGDAKRSHPGRLLQIPHRRAARRVRHDQVARFPAKADAGRGGRSGRSSSRRGGGVAAMAAVPALAAAAAAGREKAAQRFQVGARFGMDQRHVGLIIVG